MAWSWVIPGKSVCVHVWTEEKLLLKFGMLVGIMVVILGFHII
jgi:hypothetical protein